MRWVTNPPLELHYLAHLAATCMKFGSALTVDRGKELIQQDDPDCLLCAEPLDLSDLNFKPCQCGMQVSLSSFSVWISRLQLSICVEGMLIPDMPILLQQAAHLRLALSGLSKTIRCEGCSLPTSRLGRVSPIFQPLPTYFWIMKCIQHCTLPSARPGANVQSETGERKENEASQNDQTA